MTDSYGHKNWTCNQKRITSLRSPPRKDGSNLAMSSDLSAVANRGIFCIRHIFKI